MSVKDWSTQYPTALDTTTQQPTIVDNADITRASQINTMGACVRALQEEVGTDTPAAGSLRKRADDIEADLANDTGTGQIVRATSPTIAAPTVTGTLAGASETLSGTLSVTGNITNTALTASQAVFTDGSKNLVSNAVTGTGSVVMSAAPTLTGVAVAANIQVTGNVYHSVESGLTAFSGGGQASATAVTAYYSLFTAVAANLDSAKLPTITQAGQVHIIKNLSGGKKDLAVYGQSGVTMAEEGLNGYYPVADGSVIGFIATSTTQWRVLNFADRYVDMGDAGVQVADQTTLTLDGTTWNTVSLTSAIPPSAYGKLVKFRANVTDNVVASLRLRTPGFTKTTAFCSTQVANVANFEELNVQCSGTGTIEVLGSAALDTTALIVMGYWVRA